MRGSGSRKAPGRLCDLTPNPSFERTDTAKSAVPPLTVSSVGRLRNYEDHGDQEVG